MKINTLAYDYLSLTS